MNKRELLTGLLAGAVVGIPSVANASGGMVSSVDVPAYYDSRRAERIYLPITLHENRNFTPKEGRLAFFRVQHKEGPTEFPRYECRPSDEMYADLMACFDADEDTLVKELHNQHWYDQGVKYMFSNHAKCAGDTRVITMWKVK